jgi:hypothetical protein
MRLTLVVSGLLMGSLPMSVGAVALPPHPRLLLTAAEVPQVQARAAADPVLKARLDTLLRAADRALKEPVVLPDRGGQWPHWYACKADGGNLRTLSPTEHQCPVCKKVYTGWPYDDVVILYRHGALAHAVRDLGVAYAVTGQAPYAAKAREVLLAYAERYTQYPLHDKNGQAKVGGGHVGPQTLDEAVWLIEVCQGADLVWSQLSAADRQRIAGGLLRPAAECIRRHKMGIHNIQCWKNSAVGLVGLLLGDEALVADAVDSEHGFKQQIAKGVNLDGQWYEGAWGYHFYTMSALVPLAEAGERCGLGLYAFERDGRGFRKLFDGPLNLAMPSFVLPNFSDSGFVNVAGSALYEYAFRRWGDPRYTDVLRRGKADSLEALLIGVRPLPAAVERRSQSTNYRDAGYAVLQQGAGPDATWLCLKYGPHGGGHGHPDKLNVILARQGKVLACDPGTGKYGVPIHAGWQKTSIAHNTLTVDEADQKPTTGRCLAFVSEPMWAAALAEAGPVYDGVTYRRAAALVGEHLVLVLDLVEAKAERTCDLALHVAGRWATAPAGEPVALPARPGYSYLQQMVRTNAPLPLVTCEPLRLGLAVISTPDGVTWAGTGPGANTQERLPAVVRRVRGQHAAVGWALALDGQTPTLALVAEGPRWMLAATVGERAARLLVDPAGGTVRVET